MHSAYGSDTALGLPVWHQEMVWVRKEQKWVKVALSSGSPPALSPATSLEMKNSCRQSKEQACGEDLNKISINTE